MDIEIKIEDTIYECDICRLTFRFEFELQSHMVSRAEETSYESNVFESVFLKVHESKEHKNGCGSVQCQDYQKEFKSAKLLAQHVRDVHGHNSFKCELCSKCY